MTSYWLGTRKLERNWSRGIKPLTSVVLFVSLYICRSTSVSDVSNERWGGKTVVHRPVELLNHTLPPRGTAWRQAGEKLKLRCSYRKSDDTLAADFERAVPVLQSNQLIFRDISILDCGLVCTWLLSTSHWYQVYRLIFLPSKSDVMCAYVCWFVWQSNNCLKVLNKFNRKSRSPWEKERIWFDFVVKLNNLGAVTTCGIKYIFYIMKVWNYRPTHST